MGFNRLICELESACLHILNSEREPFIATKRDNYCSIEFWLIKYILSLVPSVLERANVLLCKTPWMTAIILLYTTVTDLWWKDSGLIGSPIINNWSSNWTEKTQSKMVFWKIRVCTDIVCSHYWCFASSVDAIAISKIWGYDPLTDSLTGVGAIASKRYLGNPCVYKILF